VGWLGLVMGLLGMSCLGLPAPVLRHWWRMGPAAVGGRAWRHGELWMLGAAAAMAVGTVLCRFATRRSDPLQVTALHMLIGGLPLLAATVLTPLLQGGAGGDWLAFLPDWSGIDWALMAYASLFGSALAYGLFFWFASSGDLTGFLALTFLTPVFALLCGLVLLDERLRPLQWLGVALALVSVVLLNRRQELWQGSAVPPVAAPPPGPLSGSPAGGDS